MTQLRYTKNFVENTYFQRNDGDAPDAWEQVSSEEVPIDEQIAEWVDRTQAYIIHPGQFGVYRQWMNDAKTILSITYGQSVLYTKGIPDGTTRDRQNAQAQSGTEQGRHGEAAGGERGEEDTGTEYVRVAVPARATTQSTARAILPIAVNAAAIQPTGVYPAISTPGIGPGHGPTTEQTPITSYPLTGTKCSVCGEPQHDTPGGPCCASGEHGGADPLDLYQ